MKKIFTGFILVFFLQNISFAGGQVVFHVRYAATRSVAKDFLHRLQFSSDARASYSLTIDNGVGYANKTGKISGGKITIEKVFQNSNCTLQIVCDNCMGNVDETRYTHTFYFSNIKDEIDLGTFVFIINENKWIALEDL